MAARAALSLSLSLSSLTTTPAAAALRSPVRLLRRGGGGGWQSFQAKRGSIARCVVRCVRRAVVRPHLVPRQPTANRRSERSESKAHYAHCGGHDDPRMTIKRAATVVQDRRHRGDSCGAWVRGWWWGEGGIGRNELTTTRGRRGRSTKKCFFTIVFSPFFFPSCPLSYFLPSSP